jgi:hypothetical protein
LLLPGLRFEVERRSILKTIQIPTPSVAAPIVAAPAVAAPSGATSSATDQSNQSCVDYGDELYICFAAAGKYTPDSYGSQFSPPLVEMDVNQWDLKGPYLSPKETVDVGWTFTESGTSGSFSGTIGVVPDPSCRQTTSPTCGP